MRNMSQMIYTSINNYGMYRILIDAIIAILYESIVEYYWHRLMHLPTFYRTFHKHHHYYKSPEPWDDMYIHPIEAFGYYCILYSPPFVFNMHIYAFIIYMILMGTCGILDHCGVRFHIKPIYDTAHHDAHHSKFNVNYGFPFVFMDILHGTFDD
jgi:sterol desaturase/sphingolipid hydroxylase (fatty acid hydroxylase superfamily)